jgi:PAS domain S-box-containing protein
LIHPHLAVGPRLAEVALLVVVICDPSRKDTSMPAANLFRSVREELQLVALQEILRATAAALPLGEILAIVPKLAVIAFDATIAWVMQAREGELHTVVARGAYAEAVANATCALGTGAAGRVTAGGQPAILQPGEIDPTDATLGLLARQAQPLVLLPLMSGGRILGLLGCAVPHEEVYHLTFLATLAQHACAVIESDQLRTAAHTWHQRLDAVLERMAEAVFAYDRDGTLALMNAAAATMLQGAHLQVGDTLADVVRKADLRDAQGQPLGLELMPAGRALAGERADTPQEILSRRGETEHYYQVNAVPLVREGHVQGAVAIWRDVTERKRLEDERERLYRELAERLLVAQEEERRRVTYEVHDDLAAVAASAHQHLQAFARHHRPRSPHARAELDRALELAQRTVREARRVVANLRPTTLDDFGLAAALRLQVEELRAEGWHVTYQEALGAERLPPLMETALFRVAQEALTNVRKHAQTTRVHVRLERVGREVHVAVEDAGRGFSPEAITRGTGAGERMGLLGMRERMTMLGGRCLVESQPGAGTRLSVAVSLEPPAAEGTAHDI